jgi:hypothetical protein
VSAIEKIDEWEPAFGTDSVFSLYRSKLDGCHALFIVVSGVATPFETCFIARIPSADDVAYLRSFVTNPDDRSRLSNEAEYMHVDAFGIGAWPRSDVDFFRLHFIDRLFKRHAFALYTFHFSSTASHVEHVISSAIPKYIKQSVLDRAAAIHLDLVHAPDYPFLCNPPLRHEVVHFNDCDADASDSE